VENKQEFSSVGSYLKIRLFAYDEMKDTDGRRTATKTSTRSQQYSVEDGSMLLVRLVPNDFGYYFGTDIEHFVIWFANLDGSAPQTSAAAALMYLKMMYKRQRGRDLTDDCIAMYRNHVTNSSVPDIFHYHVFVHTPATVADGAAAGTTRAQADVEEVDSKV
jgi:hypothetical protein